MFDPGLDPVTGKAFLPNTWSDIERHPFWAKYLRDMAAGRPLPMLPPTLTLGTMSEKNKFRDWVRQMAGTSAETLTQQGIDKQMAEHGGVTRFVMGAAQGLKEAAMAGVDFFERGPLGELVPGTQQSRRDYWNQGVTWTPPQGTDLGVAGKIGGVAGDVITWAPAAIPGIGQAYGAARLGYSGVQAAEGALKSIDQFEAAGGGQVGGLTRAGVAVAGFSGSAAGATGSAKRSAR
jgi:hypothetical protein